MDIFKDNKDFWKYIIGIVIMFFILIFGVSSFFGKSIFVSTTTPNNSNVPQTFTDPPTFIIDTNKRYLARFSTNFGDFDVELFPKSAPNNVNNFVFLSQRGYYDGLTFYRMVTGLLIQGGSRNTLNDNASDDEFGGPGYTIIDEINWDSIDISDMKREQLRIEGYVSNKNVASKKVEKYTLVMANAGKPNSAGSQFYIVFGDNADPRVDYLNGRHTVIGIIVTGQEVVDAIRDIKVDETDPTRPKPSEEIKITSVTILVEE